ncbi:MAG: GTP 3',8-cyclase MoaA, partial [Acinetobacter sp.]
DDLNISLDSLDADQFKQLTQKDLAPVLDGIRAAQAVGLPIKINSVLMNGINDNQILSLARWSVQEQISLRFIEFMPLDGDRKWSSEHVVSEQQILEILNTEFAVTNQDASSVRSSSEPARQYFIEGHAIGIISTITNSFCGTCDRVRLTAQGEFYNCLFAPQGLNLKTEIKALNASEPLSELSLHAALSHYIWNKESGYHGIAQRLENQRMNKNSRKISMHMLGG